jgi:hypothetical protein
MNAARLKKEKRNSSEKKREVEHTEERREREREAGENKEKESRDLYRVIKKKTRVNPRRVGLKECHN